MVNWTDPFGEYTPGKECFDWCRDAHFSHSHNIQVESLYVLALALISMGIYSMLRGTENERYGVAFINFAQVMVIGYILYVIYFL
jgi:hypothetical protein